MDALYWAAIIVGVIVGIIIFIFSIPILLTFGIAIGLIALGISVGGLGGGILLLVGIVWLVFSILLAASR